MNDWAGMASVAVAVVVFLVCFGLILSALVVPAALSMLDKLTRLVEDE